MQNRLAKSLLVAALLLSCTANVSVSQQPKQTAGANPAPAASPMEKFPKVVAVINGQTITRDQLGKECLKRYGSIVLDNLLNKHLILQACTAKGITITQADVNEEIGRVANKVGLTTKLFLEAIEQERDITPEQYAREIVWPMLALRALAADQIQVSRTEVDQMIHSEYGAKVQVRMIATSESQKSQQLHAQATAQPETFRRLAKEHSEDAASAAVEGLLPPIRRYGGDDPLEKVAFQLQPNEISPVFQIGNLHIFLQCVRHLEAQFPNPQTLALIQQRTEDQLRDEKLGLAADSIFAKLQEKSQVIAVVGNPDLERQYPGVAGYINGQPVPTDQLAAECIARHGREILRGEISRYLLTSALKSAGRTVEQSDLDAEVARAADMAGYINQDGSPDVAGWLKSIIEEDGATLELYTADAVWPSVALKKLVEDSVQITDEDLQKGFDSNFGPRAEVLAVVLSNQRSAQDVFREARANLTDQAFGELAAKFSVEPVSRSNFGKIPPIRKFSGQPVIEEAAFALQPGEISGVLAWGDQFVVLYKQGETTPIVQDFEAVREELAKEIREKKLRVAMRQKMNSMMSSAQIDNFLEGTAQTGSVVPASGQVVPGQLAPISNR